MVKVAKVFFVIGVQNKNTASYNRFLMIKKMVKMNFICETVEYRTFPKQTNIIKKILYGLIIRFNHLKALIHLPISPKNQVNILFLLSIDPFICFVAWIIGRLKGYKLVNERNEFPTPVLSGNKRKLLVYKTSILWWKYRLFDGLFLMTDALIDFYTPYVSKRCCVVKLPMTVDFDRFINLNPIQKKNEPYIFYAGSLSQKKDGVESLIRAFYKVNKQVLNLKLLIAGIGDKTNLETLIKNLNLTSNVLLLGSIPRNEIPSLLKAADILVLPRPDSIQAQGGFPTKLGEYLASGTPVIASRVGEIDTYLDDYEIVFISPNNIEDELVKGILKILNNKTEAMVKARKGTTKALNIFSLESNSKIIQQLIESISTYK